MKMKKIKERLAPYRLDAEVFDIIKDIRNECLNTGYNDGFDDGYKSAVSPYDPIAKP